MASHKMSRSLNATRTSLAVLHVAASFSPTTDMLEYSQNARNSKRLNSSSVIPRRVSGFESQEPASPKVTCIGHIKIRPPHRLKPCKQGGGGGGGRAPDKAVKEISNFSKLKKLMLGRYHKTSSTGGGGREAVKGEEDQKGSPSLGQIKRYTSASYDDKFGDMFVEEGAILAKSGSFVSPAVSKEASGINMWKRRSIQPLTDLQVESKTPAVKTLRHATADANMGFSRG